MNKRNAIVGTAGFAVSAAAVALLVQQINLAQHILDEYQYDSPEDAVKQGIKREAPSKLHDANPEEFIVLSRYQNGQRYFVIKAPYQEDGRTLHVAYIAAVKERHGKYAFIRCTADFGLCANGEIEDDDFAFYSVSKVENIDGLSFSFGKIYDKYYVPFYDGIPIPVHKDGIFAVSCIGKPPEIEMVHNGEVITCK